LVLENRFFLVFAPWVLVKMFNFQAPDIALMMLAAAVVGIFSKPLLGVAIDHFGERRVLTIDALVLMVVCAGYGLAPHLFSPSIAVILLVILYVIDDTLFSLRSAHTTYLSKIAVSEKDLTSTISVSFAIEHVVSMTGPILAGFIWVKFGFSWVFAICAVVAFIMLTAALSIPSKMCLENHQ